MKRRDHLSLFLIALTVRLAVAIVIPGPGYMDTAYYAAGAVRLAEGGGWTESFLWNYLDDPAGLPHAGYLYWMPFPSMVAAPFAALAPGSFAALQFPFAVLSALLPVVAYAITISATGRRQTAWFAGLLTLFSGYFFPYWTLPETFAPFALFGSLALWLGGRQTEKGAGRRKRIASLLAGLLVGLAHLTRADGLLLLPVIAIGSLAPFRPCNTQHGARSIIRVSRSSLASLLLTCLGYLLVMAPWFARNLSVVGELLPPYGTKTLWLRTYDDLFCYNCDLSWRSYLSWGWDEILRTKLWATSVNLERFLAEDCMVFLLPFAAIGFYRLRRRLPFIIPLGYLVLSFMAHSLVFTFPGARGGFFHASAPTLPFLFAASAEGLAAAVGWMSRRRRWRSAQAQKVFASAAVVAAAALSSYALAQKLPAWREVDATFQEVGAWLDWHGGPGDTAVMIGNPPGLWYHTRRPAVVVPSGGAQAVLAVAARYNVHYLILDSNRPVPLASVYEGITVHPQLSLVGSLRGGVRVYYIWLPRVARAIRLPS